MDLVRIPTPAELPQFPDPLNFIRQKIADGIKHASVYQKHVSIVFKKNSIFCKEEFISVGQNFAHNKIIWNLDMFEKIVEECLEMGYLDVSIKKGYTTTGGGNYGAPICDHIVMYMSWNNDSPVANCCK